MYNYIISKIKEFQFNNIENENYRYTLWMCNEIDKMNDPLKAARWIGYVSRIVEELGFWDNITTRDYIREDVRNGDE